MENSHQSFNNGHSTDQDLQIIRHPLYSPRNLSSLAWFDIRVFYVRMSNFVVDDSTPQYLSLTHIPLSQDTLLEVNGARCPIYSDGTHCVLRRDRVDKKSEEATFLSTDNIRLTGSVKFEVLDGHDVVLTGVLEMSGNNGFTEESKTNARGWSINCEPMMSANARFLKGKETTSLGRISPTVEVYVAGCYAGTPIILTTSLHFNTRKKVSRTGMLDAITEYEATERQQDDASELDLQVVDHIKSGLEEDYNSLYGDRMEYLEGEDGELSWFNAGVRVGVGIGLGICVGVGVGVGLLVRSFQITTKTVKRRLL